MSPCPEATGRRGGSRTAAPGRRLAAAALLLAAGSVPAEGQRLRDRFSELFIFGPGQDPLFLGGSATSGTQRVHGSHYIPSAVAENGSVIAFVTGSVAAQVSNVPIGTTSGAETFRFEGGVPISTSTSAGPILAERAQTLGKGRILAGIGRSSFAFSTLRGLSLDRLGLVFTHDNVDFPGCAAIAGDDCAKMGVPILENDVMHVNLALDIRVAVTSFYLTYGISDNIDLGIVLPVLRNSLDGTSSAEILPFGGTSVAHFFAGTPENPVLTSKHVVSGTATGIGDVAARLKVNLLRTPTTGIALLVDGRFPTGDERDFLGAGKFTGRALAIVSSNFGTFSPHVNVGYLQSASSTRNDMVLATAGFDQLLGRHVTLAADLVSEWQVGESSLHLPQPVRIQSPFQRVIVPTSIPDIRDDVINGSFGFKFSMPHRVTVVTNALFPLNEGSLRPRTAYTLGVEVSY